MIPMLKKLNQKCLLADTKVMILPFWDKNIADELNSPR